MKTTLCILQDNSGRVWNEAIPEEEDGSLPDVIEVAGAHYKIWHVKRSVIGADGLELRLVYKECSVRFVR